MRMVVADRMVTGIGDGGDAGVKESGLPDW